MKLVEPIAKLVCNIMKLSLHLCEFILPTEYYPCKSGAQLELQFCPNVLRRLIMVSSFMVSSVKNARALNYSVS